MRKNVADYSCYHHRHFVLLKLFDQQYFDIHDEENVDELYQFVNSGDLIINNVRDLARYLLPNIDIDAYRYITVVNERTWRPDEPG